MNEDVEAQGFSVTTDEADIHQECANESIDIGGAGVETCGGRLQAKLIPSYNLKTNDGFPGELSNIETVSDSDKLVVDKCAAISGSGEGKWASEIGVDANALGAWRVANLVEGIDWVRVPGRGRRGVIVYSEVGLAKMRECFGLGDGKGKPVIESSPESEMREFVVVKVCRNVRFIECGEESSAKPASADRLLSEIRIRVRDNRNFKPGMVVRAVPSREWGDVWDLVGRAPRYKGRW